MQDKKVSLIIPVYNGETYIKTTIENVCKQTYKNLEIIFSDDASTDNTVKIIERYSQNDPRIKILKNPTNMGQGGAKNSALSFSTGDIVCFMDSDDLLKYDIIEKCIEMMEESGADIVCFGYSSGNFDSSYKYYIYDNPFALTGYEAASAMMRKDGIDSNSWGKIYKKDLFDGILYENGRFENIAVTWRVLLRASKVYNTGLLGYAHIIRPGQVTSNYYSGTDWNYVSRTKKLVDDVRKEYPGLLQDAKSMHLEAVKYIFSKAQCGGDIPKEKYKYLSRTYDRHLRHYLKTAVSYRDVVAVMLLRTRLFGIAVKILSAINK